MIIKEYRVTLPLTVEEYQIGQLYSTAEACRNETGGGEGVEVVKNEPFNDYPLLGDKFRYGQYTYKIYHLATKAPTFIRLLAPKSATEIHEEAWNAFPYCRTVVSNPGYMKDNFIILIESYHLEGRGQEENVHQLPIDKLRIREVVTIDIGNDEINSSDYKADEDPAKFVSVRTGRGNLRDDWIQTICPVMTAYKLVTSEFKWFGLQNRVENFIHYSERRLFTIFHRKLFCWIDRWYGLTLEDIRKLEDELKIELDMQRNSGPVRGMCAD